MKPSIEASILSKTIDTLLNKEEQIAIKMRKCLHPFQEYHNIEEIAEHLEIDFDTAYTILNRAEAKLLIK